MARDLVNSTSGALITSGAPISDVPFTMACWFNMRDITTPHVVMSIGDKDVDNEYWSLEVRGDLANDPIRAVTVVDAGGAAAATTSMSMTRLRTTESAARARRTVRVGS